MGWYNHDGNFDGYKVDMSGPAPAKLKSYDELCVERGWKIRDELLHLEGYIKELIENLGMAKRDGVPLGKEMVIDGLVKAIRHMSMFDVDTFEGVHSINHYEMVGKFSLALERANEKHTEVMEAIRWKTHDDVRSSKVITIPSYFSDGQVEDEMERRKTSAFLYLNDVANTHANEYTYVDEDTLNTVKNLGERVLAKLSSDFAKLWWNPTTAEWQSTKP